jgi:hypothetical protein
LLSHSTCTAYTPGRTPLSVVSSGVSTKTIKEILEKYVEQTTNDKVGLCTLNQVDPCPITYNLSNP